MAVSFAAALAVACARREVAPSVSAGADAGAAEPATVAIARLAEPSHEGSSIALGKIGEHVIAFVADDDTRSVRAVDLDARREVGSVSLGSRLGQLVLTRAGLLAVALRDDASVALVEARTNGALRLSNKTSTDTEPVALALTPDDATLLVATGISHRLQAFKLEDGGLGERTLDVPVAREPRAVAASADGKRALVAHASASALEVVDLGASKIAATSDLGVAASPEITFVGERRPRPDLLFDALIPESEEPRGSRPSITVDDLGCNDCDVPLPARFARQAYALARVTIRSGDRTEELFVVPHTEVMTGDPMSISTGYGGGGVEDLGVDEPTERFSLSVVREDDGKRKLLAHAGDARNKDGCHLPRGAASSAGTMVVACFGSDSLMAFSVALKQIVIPAVTRKPPRKPVVTLDASGNRVVLEAPKEAAPHPAMTLHELTAESVGRVAVPAGPNGVAIDREGGRVVSFSQLDAAVSIVPLSSFGTAGAKDAGAAPAADTVPLLRASGLTEQVARGRRIFFSGGDARISKDGRACSSCHPEGRDDGLVWSTPDGPRQTIMLAGREGRKGPFGWLGKHATLQVHMQTTMKNLRGEGLPTSDQDALAAFLASLAVPEQKWRALTDEEARGRDLFNSSDTECNHCHTAKTGFTDHETHDVRSATFADPSKQFLVPSLVHVGASAPYFHDGRFATLEELLDKDNDTMGMTKQLSPADKKALVAYLRTL